MKYQEVKGDLIKMSLAGHFDVISHGCNCQCTMGAGIAPQMAKVFGCDMFEMESSNYKGNINKLGTIDFCYGYLRGDGTIFMDPDGYYKNDEKLKELVVVNSYTQFNYGKNHLDGDRKPLSYESLALCMKKINHLFKGKHIGLPTIGCGLAGGDWNRVKKIIQEELKDCDVTVVMFDK